MGKTNLPFTIVPGDRTRDRSIPEHCKYLYDKKLKEEFKELSIRKKSLPVSTHADFTKCY